MKKNVYTTFCTKIDYIMQWLRKDSFIDQQERDALAHSLSEFEPSELLKFRQLDFCHHILVCLIIMKYSNTWVG